MDHILKHASANKEQTITEVYLHVQTTNQEALSFYKNQGFEITGTSENYYKNIDDKDAYVLTKPIHQWLSLSDTANILVNTFNVFNTTPDTTRSMYSHYKKLWIEKRLSW